MISQYNSTSSQSKSIEEILSAFAKNAVAGSYTSLPAIVTAYDSIKNTASIEFVCQQSYLSESGDLEYMGLTPLSGVPVMLTRAGSHVVTLPISIGDECWVQFSHKSMSGFLSSGKSELPVHLDNGDIIDAVIVMKQISAPKNAELKNISTDSYQIRKADNTDSFIEYKGSTETTTIKASADVSAIINPDGINLVAGTSTIVISKDGTITITAKGSGIMTLTDSLLTSSVPIQAPSFSGPSGGIASMTSGLDVGTNPITAKGIDLGTHVHSDPQGGTTGAPQ